MNNSQFNKIELLSCGDKYVYILARKLGKDDEITDSPKIARKRDWGFLSTYDTMKKAENHLWKCIDNMRNVPQGHGTFGIISIEKGKLVLLKSVSV